MESTPFILQNVIAEKEKSNSRRTSVLMLTNADLKNGIADIPYFFYQKANALRRHGWCVTLEVLDSRTSVRGLLRNYRRLKQQVELLDPGVVHAKYGSVTAAMAHWIRGNRPLVVSFIGSDLLGVPIPGVVWRVRGRVARWIGLWTARRAEAIFVRSQNLLDALPSALRAKTIVLPDGVDLDWYRPLDKEECRNRLGWSQRSKIVLFNASTGPNCYIKNPTLAQETIKILSQMIPEVTLYMMAGASSEEVCWMLNAADCLLVTSLHEGSPKIVQEALACDLPVVSVPCGDVSERLNGVHPSGVCGYDARALAQQIRAVLEIGERSNGREQLIKQELTTTKYAERAIQVYHSVQRR